MDDFKKALGKFKDQKILVIGDLMLDKYSFGDVSRISPEAPVPIFLKKSEKYVPGGAANVAANLSALGAQVLLCGVIGQDKSGEVLVQILEENNINTKLILSVNTIQTTVKNRFLSGNNQLLRVDEEDTLNIDNKLEKRLLTLLNEAIASSDGLILSDYNKGFFSKELTQEIIKSAKKHKKVIIADIKPANKELFEGVDIVKPNLKEAKEMSGQSEIEKIGKELVGFFHSSVVITKGEEGISIFPKVGKPEHLSTKKIKVFDVSGAGDTVVSVLTLGLVSGLGLKDAAFLANYAGGVVVQKLGTATISAEELQSAVHGGNHIDEVTLIPKLWGYEKWLENNEKYCSKLLSLNQGYQCSLHYHKIKDETFLIIKGYVRMEVGKEILYMKEGSFVRITPGTLHRFRGLKDSEIIEISTHHMEEDSYRVKGEESRKVAPE